MSARFARETARHPLRVRHVEVAAVTPLPGPMARVTLRGAELAGFVAAGPADHVKVFFPDPATGELVTPVVTDEGVRRPETGTVIARDYTPLGFRPDAAGGPELDIDFVLHGDDGPASAWALRAAPGDALAFAGPRGSHLAPEGVGSAVLVADETALPAVLRWLDALGPDIPVTGLFAVADTATAGYPVDRPNLDARWFSGAGRDARLEEALRAVERDERTFFFLAGEAGAMVPLRRHLRRELGLPREQVEAHGYWKRGVVNLDHHAPLDPGDPD